MYEGKKDKELAAELLREAESIDPDVARDGLRKGQKSGA
jgi:hypothetical protein